MYLKSIFNKHELTGILDACKPDNDLVFIAVAEKSKDQLPVIMEQFNDRKIQFYGAIFPSLILNGTRQPDGFLINIGKLTIKPLLIQNMSQFRKELLQPLEDLSTSTSLSIMILTDGLAANIRNLLSGIYDVFGNRRKYFGGGAGSMSLKPIPCIFTNEGIFQDAAVISQVNFVFNLGIRHGWKNIEGPFVATKTTQNIIQELNWQPATDIYKKYVEVHSGRKLNIDNFFSISKGYPFGMFKEEGEAIVRDPIAMTESGNLICVGGIPQNSVLGILKGEKSNLIKAAQEAATISMQQNTQDIFSCFVIDCISRVLFLGDAFDEELSAITNVIKSRNKAVDVEGVLSIGEIGSSESGYLELYNKTVVVNTYYAK